MMEGMFARLIVHPRSFKGERPGLAQPFLGLRRTQTSLQFKTGAATTGADGRISLQGAVSVFQAFSVFTQPIQVRFGDKSVSLKPDRKGFAQADGVTCRVKNASAFGVVYGGVMEFELELSGNAWLAELRRHQQNPAATGPADIEVPVELKVGDARHITTARIRAAGVRTN
jgi:hypothetical protein